MVEAKPLILWKVYVDYVEYVIYIITTYYCIYLM